MTYHWSVKIVNRNTTRYGAKMIHLSQHEREKFAAWLEQDAESNKGMIRQWEKMAGPQHAVIVDHLKRDVAACLIIMKKLRNIEEMTIEGPK